MEGDMDAIEFETVSDGQNIRIPDQYKGFNSMPVKVIVLKSAENRSRKSLSELLNHPMVVEKIHVYSKDELNG